MAHQQIEGRIYATTAPVNARDVHKHLHPIWEARTDDLAQYHAGLLQADTVEGPLGERFILLRPVGSLHESKK